MKKFFQSFYGKLSAVFLVLLLILGTAQILITLQASMRFVKETDQKLNLNLAENMAIELESALRDSINLAEIEHRIHYMMVMNPKVEIYVLDERGKILAFFADPPKKVRTAFVNLDAIRQFISGRKHDLMLGPDPRLPGREKPFSAAVLPIGKNEDGFLYIVLGGEEYDSAAEMVRSSFIVQTTIKGLIVTLIFSGIIGLILFSFLTKRLHRLTHVVKEFEKGDYGRRAPVKSHDEIGQLGSAFNHMADTIVANLEELKRTDQLRRELVANVSHDLRSPLASIQGYLETILMKESNLSPEERVQYLETILNNTTMLSHLVEELFDLSKLDACQIRPKTESFSLAELAQDVVMKFRPAAQKASIHLEAVLPPDLPPVSGDIGLIERVMSNLLENAIRYTPEKGAVKVVLSEAGENVRVTVADSGPGIPPQDLPHIFERFYRVEKSRGRGKGGTGLGLAIAKKIMELHNSTVSVKSELNVGTQFFFDLKIRREN